MRHLRYVVGALVILFVAAGAHADVGMSHIFGSHMVLQQEKNIQVWGWADAGERVEVKLGDAAPVATEAGDDGKWSVTLPPLKSGGPLTMTVTGKNTLTFEDILIGEVWLCSGQSNMEMAVNGCLNAAEERASANYPNIRQIKVPRVPAGEPVRDFDGAWQVCGPETVGGWTAAGYFFGRHLHQELDVPIGLVNSSWGGTRIEPWTPPVGFAQVPALKGIHDQVTLANPKSDPYKTRLGEYLGALETWMATAKASLAEGAVLEPSPVYPEEIKPLNTHAVPTGLYNGMIAPLVPFAIRGAIWYQGESNHGEGMLYVEKTKALVAGWRDLWSEPDLPYYYVQIAPYIYGEEDPNVMPIFWEAQAAAEAIPNTGMAVITDIADLNDIHPKNKQDVGKRLALLALNRTYGQEDVVDSGPTFRSLAQEGSKLRVTFDNVGSGLASRDGQALSWFHIIGSETDFELANAEIAGDSVLLSSPKVPDPCAVRFGWHKNAMPNLMNREGLPAGAFRAGEVPVIDYLTVKVEEAKGYELVYDLDLAKLGKEPQYDVDSSGTLGKAFDRVAYFLDLRKSSGRAEYVYVSMDAFTDDLKKIGVPSLATGAVFQQNVANMTVLSNVDGIVAGTGLTGGNIEFWSHNYGPPNSASVPNASTSVWDFGDQYSDPVDGYGCMQVHNHEAKQTILAVNHWVAGATADIGIGDSDGDTRDWTFKANAGTYEVKRLRVLVRPKG